MTETKKFRRRAEARPDEVLDAALSVFVARGFAATKVDDIARQAGVSKGTVYLYFPSKEALLEGIVQRAMAPIADSAAPDLAQFEGDPRLPIAMVLHMLCKTLGQPDKIDILKLILREAMNFPAIAEMYRRHVLDKMVPALTGLLARGVEQGHLRPVDPELTIRSVVGPLIAHIALSEIFDIRPSDGMALERLVENHIDILFHGISAEPQEARP